MSWGFFLDLDLALPTPEWKRLQATPGSALPAGWWGFEEADLENRFSGPVFDGVTFKKVFAFWAHGESAAKSVVDAKGITTVQLTIHLDRGGDIQVAKPVAALFDAASKVGGRGRIRLVNDGSYSGESGVEIAIDDGALIRSTVSDDPDLLETLQLRVFPELAGIVNHYTSKPAKPPATKKPAAKKPVKKPAAKKPAANKAAPPRRAKPRR